MWHIWILPLASCLCPLINETFCITLARIVCVAKKESIVERINGILNSTMWIEFNLQILYGYVNSLLTCSS